MILKTILTENNKKALPALINLKYGERNKKIFRLAKIKSEEFIYSNIITLIKVYKPIKNNFNICLILHKNGFKEEIIIEDQNEFNEMFKNNGLLNFLEKESLKIEFFYKQDAAGIIKKKINNLELEKTFQEMSSDSNSKFVLDFIINYISKERDFPDKLYDNLKEKLLIKEDDLNKEEFSNEIVPCLLNNIKENYDTLVFTRTNLDNLNLNISFNKAAINTSYDDIENNQDFKPFSEVYKRNEIEDFSSRIVRDTLSSIQILK